MVGKASKTDDRSSGDKEKGLLYKKCMTPFKSEKQERIDNMESRNSSLLRRSHCGYYRVDEKNEEAKPRDR